MNVDNNLLRIEMIFEVLNVKLRNGLGDAAESFFSGGNQATFIAILSLLVFMLLKANLMPFHAIRGCASLSKSLVMVQKFSSRSMLTATSQSLIGISESSVCSPGS